MDESDQAANHGSQALRERLAHRARELEGLLEASAGLIFRVRTSDLGVVYAAPNTGDVTGIPAERWLEKPQLWAERLPDEDVEEIVERVWDARDSGWDRFHLEFRLRHADDELHWYRGVFQFERDEEDAPVSFVGTAVDVTEEHRRKEELRRQRERYRALFEDAAEAILVSDRTGVIQEVNDAFVELSGYARDEIEGAHAPDFYADPARRKEVVERLQSTGQVEEFVVRLRRADGAIRYCRMSASQLETSDGKLIQAVLRDVTERRRHREALQHQALHDPLTGLPNRSLFWDRLQQAVARVERRGGVGALLYLDLNGFKYVNDRHGHQAGDEVLVEVGRRVSDAIRDSDTVARIGGDEFVVVLPELTARNEAREVAQRVLETLTEPIRTESTDVRLSAAGGISFISDEDGAAAVQTSEARDDPDALLQRADAAMYRAKEEDGSAVAFFSPELDEAQGSS